MFTYHAIEMGAKRTPRTEKKTRPKRSHAARDGVLGGKLINVGGAGQARVGAKYRGTKRAAVRAVGHRVQQGCLVVGKLVHETYATSS